jgi:integrase
VASIKVACDAKGNYRRELGWKRKSEGGYRQHCFSLGRDRAQAAIRSLQLETVWEAVQKQWQRDRETERPLWDDDTLAVASAVAKGERVVTLTMPPTADNLSDCPPGGQVLRAEIATEWLFRLRRDFPMVEIHFDNPAIETTGTDRLQQAAVDHEQAAEMIRQLTGGAKGGANGQTLHKAIDAFAEALKTTYRAADGRPTQWACLKARLLRYIKEAAADCPLSAFGLSAIDGLVIYWKNRPVAKKTGKPCSVAYCREMVKTLREFVKWLHRSPDWKWRRPDDYETFPVRIRVSAAELARRLTPHQVQTFTTDQLATLYHVAPYATRAMMLLALNCGFGAAEIVSLQLAEIHLDKPHGHYSIHGSFVKRLRFKSKVYGEWKLWPETAVAVRAYIDRRPETAETTLFVSRNGRTYDHVTASGQRNSVAKAWDRTMRRAGLHGLSFNKLRKTGADLVKRATDGETAAVFLAHGQTVAGDELADLYTNRHFDKVFAATDRVRETLAPVFGDVRDKI